VTIRSERDQDRMISGGIWNIDYRGSLEFLMFYRQLKILLFLPDSFIVYFGI
jgi:hypothetical protein